MKTKNLFLIILGVILVFGAAAILERTNKPGNASARELPQNLPTPTALSETKPGGSAQVLEKFADSEITTQMVNGVEMSAANFRVEQNEIIGMDELRADVCFLLPNSEDWLIRDARLQTGDVEIPGDGAGLIEVLRTHPNGQKRIYVGSSSTYLDSPTDTLPEYRCDTVRFRLEKEVDLSSFTLEIRSIFASPLEGTGCEAFFENVQSILDAENTGIRVDCVKQEYGEFMSIADKPESLSEEEALRLLSEAQRRITLIEGPWVFTGSIK
jgi:hypothetical protein